jgi:hypothetical protein
MTTFAPLSLPQIAPPDPLKHVDYQLGMVLGVADFQQEFTYHSEREKRIVRDLLGYGVVCGLRVTVQTGDDQRGPRVNVAPGEAVTPSGQFVCVSPSQCAYLNDWLQAHRDAVDELASPPPSVLQLAVVACYQECETDDVPIPGEPCRSEDELRKPSRLRDGFALDLRLAAPPQLEEQAVRAFVAWARRIPVVDEPPGDVETDFLEEIRLAADLEGSPPSSPPGLLDFLYAPPPASLRIPRAAAATYLEALLSFWASELRPRLRSAVPGAECGCGGGPGALDADADCLCLAELTVWLDTDAPTGNLVVADTPAVVVDESARPALLHLRLLQEWLLALTDSAAGAAASISGVVLADGTVAAASGGLVATRLADPVLFVLQYPGFAPAGARVVTGQALTTVADVQASTFEVIAPDDPGLGGVLGSPPTEGVVVRVRRSDGTAVPDGFMVRIEELAP